MSLELTDRVRPLVEAVKTFITERVLPVDHEFMQEVNKGDHWTLTDRQNEILDDLKSAAMYMGARTLRLADGPDEVHRMVVARKELSPYIKESKQ